MKETLHGPISRQLAWGTEDIHHALHILCSPDSSATFTQAAQGLHPLLFELPLQSRMQSRMSEDILGILPGQVLDQGSGGGEPRVHD